MLTEDPAGATLGPCTHPKVDFVNDELRCLVCGDGVDEHEYEGMNR
jgi:hypothetical protein